MVEREFLDKSKPVEHYDPLPSCALKKCVHVENKGTRPDKRLPLSRVGGQGLNLRSLDHLGRSSEAKDGKNPKKVKCDGPTDRPTDGQTDRPTKRVIESRCTQLKICDQSTNRTMYKVGCRVVCICLKIVKNFFIMIL